MCFARCIFIFGLIAFFFTNFYITIAFKFKMTNVACESFNKTLVVFVECRLRAISRNKTTLTSQANILQSVNGGKLRIKMFKRENGFKPWLMDYTLDVCAFFRKRNHPIGKVLLDVIEGTHTFNHTCPYVGINGVKDFYYPFTLNLPIPTGDYRIDLMWSMHNKIVAKNEFYFSFIEDF